MPPTRAFSFYLKKPRLAKGEHALFEKKASYINCNPIYGNNFARQVVSIRVDDKVTEMSDRIQKKVKNPATLWPRVRTDALS